MKNLVIYLLLLLSFSLPAKEYVNYSQINSEDLQETYPNLIFTEQQYLYQERKTRPSLSVEKESLSITSQQLLEQPDLLKMAMISLIRKNNIVGIEKILPIYKQSKISNPYLVSYAEGVLFLHYGYANKSALAFQNVLQQYPTAEVANYYYGLANFYNKNYFTARNVFSKLNQINDLPKDIKKQIDKYAQRVDQITAWKTNFNLSLFYDRNINNAPDQQKWGNFRFSDKKSDIGLMYQLGLSKKFILPQGFYLQPNIYFYGKQYSHYREYNDFNSRFGFLMAYANQYNDFSIQPYIAKRLYGEKSYSRTLGNQFNWLYDWNDRFSTLISFSYEHQYFDQQKFLNNHRQIFNFTALYALTNNHILSFSPEIIHQYATRDLDDSYLGWNIKTDWRANWKNGLGTTLTLIYGKNKYKGATLLTQTENRKDQKYGITLQLKHSKLQYAGFQPALSLHYYAHKSNSALHRYTRKEVFFNINKIF